jgi:hypothetical protein
LSRITGLHPFHDVVWTAVLDHIENTPHLWVAAIIGAFLPVIALKIFFPNAHAILTEISQGASAVIVAFIAT